MSTGIEQKVRRAILIGGLVLGGVTVLAIILSITFVESQKRRDLLAWNDRLSLVADSRLAALDGWLKGQWAVIEEIAGNESVRLALMEGAGDGVLGEEERANLVSEIQYLSNYLNATARREGFMSEIQPVAANLDGGPPVGLAVLDATNRPLIASGRFSGLETVVRDAAIEARDRGRALIDLRASTAGPVLGFAHAIQPVMGLPDAPPVGVVVGLRPLGESVWTLLAQPGDVSESGETYLVRRQGDRIDYLSPLSDGTGALKRSLTMSADPSLAAVQALTSPGEFHEGLNAQGLPVLSVSRPVPGTPWLLIRSVTRAEALAESEGRASLILVVFLLLIAGFVGAVVAVWRHGTSLRAERAAEAQRSLAAKLEGILQYLRVVLDSQPTAIAAFDKSGRYTLANRHAAEMAGLAVQDIVSKPLEGAIGPAAAKPILDTNAEVFETGEPHCHVLTLRTRDELRLHKVDHVPLPDDGEKGDGVLVIAEDITELTNEQQRSRDLMSQLVATLVELVDRRDPNTADHSAKVARVAADIAEEMDLSEPLKDTVTLTGQLMNVGRIFVPREVLTKKGNLTEAEQAQVADCLAVGTDILDHVSFDGPVVKSIRQVTEHWDGSGANGLKGEDITKPARIVAVANAFVGMVSARAYRDPKPWPEVSRILSEQSDHLYDRAVVVALMNLVENRNGLKRWEINNGRLS
ncbi:HD domain-containing phosphohydrolase [Magnetospira sp. QH-2]|uniref:HD domain-containing phosphohydrolase n=1 Tax=Magnetospira sp. (strain QH-2) TaxID=1288970 RepID=UPI0003E80A5B|nr:HD domain-containing phosphohydrolase [Magnetospira sp. QH-2]CCQ75235.1 putative Metal-dependent phosphohydrolase with PAS sensor domain [Magnetospira sp. QH-2]